MWANLHAFEHNNLDGMTLFPAPKYGHTLLRSWARKTSISDHLVEEWRPNTVSFMFELDGLHGLRDGRLIGLRCIFQAGNWSVFTLRGTVLAGRKQWRFRAGWMGAAVMVEGPKLEGVSPGRGGGARRLNDEGKAGASMITAQFS